MIVTRRTRFFRRWTGDKPTTAKEVIVDPEFGAFGDNGCIDFIKSEFDKNVDAGSLFPGSFTYEKYFAGKYIGEIARQMILALTKDSLLFRGQNLSKLSEKDYVFTAEDVSNIEQDNLDGSNSKTTEICSRFGLVPDSDDVSVLKYVCSLLVHRCALLVGIPLAVMISRLGKKDPQVGGNREHKIKTHLPAEYFVKCDLSDPIFFDLIYMYLSLIHI